MKFFWLMVALTALPCMLADLSPRVRAVLQAVQDALHKARITPKEACGLMGLSKSQWSRICAGDLHLPLDLLVLLPLAFQMEFVPLYTFHVVQQAAQEIVDDVQQRNAS